MDMVMWTTHNKRRIKRSNRRIQVTRALTTLAMMHQWCQWTIWATYNLARISLWWINPIKPIMLLRQARWALLPFLNRQISQMAWLTLCKYRNNKDSNSNCRIRPVWLVKIIKCNRPCSNWWHLFKAKRLPYWKEWTLKAKAARKLPIKMWARKW